MPMLFPESMLLAKADALACRTLLRTGSRSFAAASRLLPPDIREAATAIYAFCRLADDIIDVEGGQDNAIAQLRGRLNRAYRGQPLANPVDRAFAATVERYGIPQELPGALLEGLSWDAENRRFETLSDLHGYAARVAGSVGMMMACIMGATSQAALARASDLGAAMQLTNIARDVGEDARNGRIYLPLAWLKEEGMTAEALLRNPTFTPALGRVVERILAEADRLYAQADAGIAMLPLRCRPGMRAAARIYAAIGTKVTENNFDSMTSRARVGSWRKLRLLALAHLPIRHPDARSSLPPIPETRFLLAAAAGHEAARVRQSEKRDFTRRIVWAIDLLHRVELRRQALQSGG